MGNHNSKIAGESAEGDVCHASAGGDDHAGGGDRIFHLVTRTR
jgi:hypothetical protein